VAAGNYVGEIALQGKDNLSLLGAGADESVLVGPSSSSGNGAATLRFTNSHGSTVNGFTITRDGNTKAEWEDNKKSHGVAFGGGSNNTLEFSKISGNRNGIILDNSFGNTIQNNLIDNNRTGFNIQDGANNNTITHNFITNNWTFGVFFADSVVTATGNAFHNNNISGNWYSQVEDQSLAPGGVRDFSGNWLGTNAVTKTVGNTTHPGYLAQVPVEFGGTAVPPGSARTVSGASAGKIDYSPWLDVGADIDADPSNGFQGDFSTLHVDDDSAQTGTVGRIQEAVNLLTGTTVLVNNGTYLESNIELDKPVKIDGESRAGVIVAPAGEDANLDGPGNFAGAYQHGFVIQSSNVTIQDLTVDGEANAGLTPGKNNYRAGIVTNPSLDEAFHNTKIDNVAVRNVYRRGIQLDSGNLTDGNSTGNTITGSIVDGVDSAAAGYAIVALNSDTLISGNKVSNAANGIGTNYTVDEANAPLVTIRANTITNTGVGISASGLADGSLIGGPLAVDANQITLTTKASADVGIVVQYAVGQVTVQRNTISGLGGDAGIWLFHNEDADAPVIVRQNSITSGAGVAANPGEGTGIFLTDDGDLFGDEDGDSYAVLLGNTITGFARGIDLFRNADSLITPRNVAATIGGPLSSESNTLAANSTGIRVYEVDADDNGGRLAVAKVLDNNFSLVANGIGIDIDGGAAILTNNRITSNATGVLVRNEGAATLQNNDLRNNTVVGLQIESGAIVDAGQVGTGSDYTGLGISTGGNNFSTYTPGPTQPRAIINANSAAPNQLAGAQGAPYDVSAEGNTFWSATAANIEAVVDHDRDNSLVGLVDFADPTLGALATGTVNEGSPYSLNVTFTGASTNHKVTINWGDGDIEEIAVAPGVFSITPSHTYADDNPTATASDVLSISVTVAEVAGGGSDSDTTSVTVSNVAPTLGGLVATPVSEGGEVHFSGNIVDPGADDTFTLLVDWGDGSAPETFTYAAGTTTFDEVHTYVDDNPTLTNNDNYTISVTLTDDDTGSSSSSATANVANVAPVVSNVSLTSPVNEGGPVTLSGDITDPGTEDTFTLTVDWGDGSAPETFTYAAGTTSFSEAHAYADNDDFPVTFTLTDDDSGQDTGGGTVSVANVAATLSGVSLTPAIKENGVATLSGGIVDPGTGDTFTLVVNWGDGSPAETFTYPAGTTTFSETHQYLDDKPSVTTSDAYTVSLTLSDDDSGTATASKTVTVANVAPLLTNILLSSPITEGSSASLSFDIVDPGTLDTFVLVVNWGDGSGPQNYNLPAGTTTYSLNHAYPDDNPTGTSSDVYSVSVAIADDDFGADSESRSLTVQNSAPLVSAGADTTVDLGNPFTRSGSFTDLGVNDTFTATVDYGDGSGVQPLALTGNTFSLSHNYTSAGPFTVTVKVTDDDLGVGTDTVSVLVTNVLPTGDIVDVAPDPRSTAVDTIYIVFSEPVTGFELADLILSRNGGPNLLTGAQSLSTVDHATFTLNNLGTLTGVQGAYTLTLAGASAGIADSGGNAFTDTLSDAWVMSLVDIQAENFARRQAGNGHTWWIVDAEQPGVGSFVGATGPSVDFMQALTLAGADSSSGSVAGPNEPSLEYDVSIITPGLYNLGVRVAGVSSASDSLWIGSSTGTLQDAQGNSVSGGALHVDTSTNGVFQSRNAGQWYLTAGTHTFRVSMRESGATIDSLQLSMPQVTPISGATEIQAESYSSRADANNHRWWAVNTEAPGVGSFSGATGPSQDYLQSLNLSAQNTTVGNLSPAGPDAEYTIQVVTPGVHSLQLRVAGIDSSSDSLWVTIPTGTLVDAQGNSLSGTSLLVATNTSGVFELRGAGLWDLPAGNHTVRVSMRESGAAVDALRIVPSTPVPIVGATEIQAESFSRRQSANGHQWSRVDQEVAGVGTISGATGSTNDYLQSLTSAGQDSTFGSISGPAGPFVEYDIEVSDTDVYDVSLRVAGVSSSSDSVWIEVPTGTLADDQGNSVVGDALVIHTGGSTFVNRFGGRWLLSAGIHRVRISMRESGAAIDSLTIVPPSAAVPIDGPTEIQAEDFARRQGGAGHAWWQVNAEQPGVGTFVGATGASNDFMQSLTQAGVDSTYGNVAAAAEPSLEYEVLVTTPGEYDVQLKVAGTNSSSDSLWLGSSTATLQDAQGNVVTSGSLRIETNTTGVFQQRNAGRWFLTAGVHTFRVSMRESGAAIDALTFTPVANAFALQAQGTSQTATTDRQAAALAIALSASADADELEETLGLLFGNG
jgi:parallel beta-helix repeat protein